MDSSELHRFSFSRQGRRQRRQVTIAIARIHAVVCRSKGHSESVIRTGKLAVNLDTSTVEVDGHPLHLTGKEYRILQLLSLHKGVTLSKEKFHDHLYGGMDEPKFKIIDVFICKLRKNDPALARPVLPCYSHGNIKVFPAVKMPGWKLQLSTPRRPRPSP